MRRFARAGSSTVRPAQERRGEVDGPRAEASVGLGASDADPVELGLVAPSRFLDLMMHGAYDGDVEGATCERAYELLARAAERSGAAGRR